MSMIMTEDDIDKANAIKSLVEMDDSLENLSDYECVQYALTHGGDANNNNNNNLGDILEFVSKMQLFQRRYNIQNTVEDAVACLQEAATNVCPGHILGNHSLPEGNVMLTDDWAAFVPSQFVHDEERIASFLRGNYYRFESAFPSFLAMKLGVVILVECEGTGWDNYDSRFFERLYDELYIPYPKRHAATYCCNSPTVINMAFALWKRTFTNPNLRQSLHLGYQIPGDDDYNGDSTIMEGHGHGRRLDQLFLQPDLQTATKNMIATTAKLLQLRYQRMATFVLPEPPDFL